MTEALHEEIDPHPVRVGLIIPGNWMMGHHYAVTTHSLTALMAVVDNGAPLMPVRIRCTDMYCFKFNYM